MSAKRYSVVSERTNTGYLNFRFATAAEIAERQRAEFEQSNPKLAMWMKIKAALAEAGYFENQMKDSAVPQLRGVLIEAKPACRPKELLVAVPLPGAPTPPAGEIRLKLDKPLAGQTHDWRGASVGGRSSGLHCRTFFVDHGRRGR